MTVHGDKPPRQSSVGPPAGLCCVQAPSIHRRTEIIRILRERELTGAAAAKLAGVQEADVSRIRNADLDRFTIDRLVKILNHLDRRVEVHVTFRPAAATGNPAPALGAE